MALMVGEISFDLYILSWLCYLKPCENKLFHTYQLRFKMNQLTLQWYLSSIHSINI